MPCRADGMSELNPEVPESPVGEPTWNQGPNKKTSGIVFGNELHIDVPTGPSGKLA